jgi:hypothetical protein
MKEVSIIPKALALLWSGRWLDFLISKVFDLFEKKK